MAKPSALQVEVTYKAKRILLSGKVQGVGFRPFVYRLAKHYDLQGWVRNNVGVVEIQVQGREDNIQQFLEAIFTQQPALAMPCLESEENIALSGFESFEILLSNEHGEANISVPADLFLCDDCLREMNDPEDRRYQYPFINCTQCGPRYTLIKSLPYDRRNTTMADFTLCPQCAAEYHDPSNRRFHAEPIACPACGPQLTYHENTTSLNKTVYRNDAAALQHAVSALQQGKVVAVKGIGGYHLLCDASNNVVVNKLRATKPRPDKPFAVMFPTQSDAPFAVIDDYVHLNAEEKAFLLQPARPILLVQKKADNKLAATIAPNLNELGVMLPYSPLHHLLLNTMAVPLVATSANISGEPVLTSEQEVEQRLQHVADAFLHHDREIERPADDPVYRTIADKPRPLRLGRGIAPTEIKLPFELEIPVLAVGAHMKNSITLAWKDRAVISPHIGEMGAARSLQIFEKTIADLQQLYGIEVQRIICDAHAAYTTSRWAQKQGLPVHKVYHHHAHASAAYYECRQKFDTEKPVLVFTWDGVGLGDDNTFWGGETFLGTAGNWHRVASMQPFELAGGDKVSREPWRSAAALCWQFGLDYPFENEQSELLHQVWQRKMNTTQSSSVGRIFDAAAALLGVRDIASFEGQGPMELEALCESDYGDMKNKIDLSLSYNDNMLIIDYKPLIISLLDSTLTTVERACLLHSSLAHSILKQAELFRDKYGVKQISFSGGVFQNRILSERAMALLATNGFDVCLPEQIPVNDAGISFGQIMDYAYTQKSGQ